MIVLKYLELFVWFTNAKKYIFQCENIHFVTISMYLWQAGILNGGTEKKSADWDQKTSAELCILNIYKSSSLDETL